MVSHVISKIFEIQLVAFHVIFKHNLWLLFLAVYGSFEEAFKREVMPNRH